MKQKRIKIPEWDSLELRPKTKMPNCPVCDEDELGMLAKNNLFCYNCGFEMNNHDGHWTDNSVIAGETKFVGV